MGKKQSPARAARRAAAQAAARTEQEQPPERVLQAVPDPTPEPEPSAPSKPQLNFMLAPGGRMGTRLSVVTKASVKFTGPMKAHLGAFQAEYQGHRYKVQNGSVALWRALLEERHQMILEAEAEEARTGVPVEPRMGPIQQAFEEQLDRMAAEESGDVFDED
jgi:hypothetical protein